MRSVKRGLVLAIIGGALGCGVMVAAGTLNHDRRSAAVAAWVSANRPAQNSTAPTEPRRYVRLAPLGHGGAFEVMTALGYIRNMANRWDLQQQDKAGQPLVDDTLLAFLASRPGFETFAEFGVMYEMLFAYNFEGAMRLARLVLQYRPKSTTTSFALAFILDRVFGQRREGGEVLLEAAQQRELPAWVTDLAQKMIRGEPDAPDKHASQARADFMCDFLARIQNPEAYPLLLERCRSVGPSRTSSD